MLPAHALTAAQVRQVFGDRSIRTEAEQIAILTGRTSAPVKPGRTPKRGKVRADREGRAIRIGRSSAPVADVVAALADLSSPTGEEEGELDEVVAVRLTAAEKRKLAHAAIEGNATQQDLVRRALRMAGVI